MKFTKTNIRNSVRASSPGGSAAVSKNIAVKAKKKKVSPKIPNDLLKQFDVLNINT